MRPHLALLVLLLAAFAGLAQAQPLTVADALRLAEAAHPALRALDAQLDAQAGLRRQSYGLHTPEVRYAREGIDGTDFNEQRWTFTQSIDNPLSTRRLRRRLDAEATTLQHRREALRRDLRAAIKRAYTDVLFTQELIHLREQEVTLAERLGQAVGTRVEVGEAAALDQMKVDLQRDAALTSLAAAQQQYEEARYALFRAIGIDPDAQAYTLAFPDTLAFVALDVPQDAVMAALAHQPQQRAADQALVAAQVGVRYAQSTAWPGLSLSVGPQDFGTGFDFQLVEVGVQVPLWGFLNRRGAVESAQARVQAEQAAQEALRLDLKEAAENAWHRYDTARRTLNRYTAEVLTRATELLALTQEGYQLGELDLLTLLDTQRTVIQSQQRFYDTLRDYYYALVELERVLGQDLVFE